jgi:hypothetical protein
MAERSLYFYGIDPNTLERLEGYEILPLQPGAGAVTLILRTKSSEFLCVAGREALLRLVGAIHKHLPPDESA